MLLLDDLRRHHAHVVYLNCGLHLGFLALVRVEVDVLETVLVEDHACIMRLSEAVEGPMLTRRLRYHLGGYLRVALCEAILKHVSVPLHFLLLQRISFRVVINPNPAIFVVLLEPIALLLNLLEELLLDLVAQLAQAVPLRNLLTVLEARRRGSAA